MTEAASGGPRGGRGGGAALARRKGTLVAFVAGFAALGLVINNVTPAVYRATVRIELRAPLDRSPLTGEAVGNASFQSENVAMYTAADLITNRRVLGQLVDAVVPRRRGLT